MEECHERNFIDIRNQFRRVLTPRVDANNGDNNNALTVRAGGDGARKTIDQILRGLREQQEALNRISDDPATGAEDP